MRRASSYVLQASFLAAACLASLAPGQSRAVATDQPCVLQTFETSRFTVCTFDSRKDELRLELKDKHGADLGSLGRLADWLGPDAARVLFAMNAGMFEPDGAPTGLFVTDGQQIASLNTREGRNNFYLKPNGVFSVDTGGTVRVETTQSYAGRGAHPVWATQSGPMLVIDGALNPAFDADGTSKFVRNGVATANAHTALFIISEGPVSFGRFARFFRDALGCRNALYFDGSISSLWEPSARRRDAGPRLGPMVVVLAKSDAVQ
jgi:uncharacterized protein YigE (DUF2233 family)